MFVRKRAYDGRSNGLAQREQGAEGSAEEDNVIAVVDGFGEGVFVGVEGCEDACEDGGVAAGEGGGFEVAVEFEELGEEGEDECEGDLERLLALH